MLIGNDHLNYLVYVWKIYNECLWKCFHFVKESGSYSLIKLLGLFVQNITKFGKDILTNSSFMEGVPFKIIQYNCGKFFENFRKPFANSYLMYNCIHLQSNGALICENMLWNLESTCFTDYLVLWWIL